MSKRVLVPLDGSTRSERALPVAARLAGPGGAVVLLRVANPHLGYGAYRDPGDRPPAPIDAEYNESYIYLATIGRDEALRGPSIQIDVRTGPVVETIAASARDHDIGVIAMNSHGRTGFSHRVLGGVAEMVVRHSSVPVLALRDLGPLPDLPRPGAGRPLRGLVALDGSPLAEVAVVPAAECIAALATPTRAELHLLRVLRPSHLSHWSAIEPGEAGEYLPSDGRKTPIEEAEGALGALATDLAAGPLAGMNLVVTWSVAFSRDVAKAIIHAALEGDTSHGGGPVGGADMIALATHARGGLTQWALGSVTETVLRGTCVPVLVVHRARGDAREVAVRTDTGAEPSGFPPLL